MSEKFWKPWPKQEFALKTVAFEILYGGSRGPGKTDAGMVWMTKCLENPRFRGLVIRKNAEDLKDWIDRARWMYSGLDADFKGKPVEIGLPSGAKILTGHLKDDNAYEKYQGHEYQRMLIEELTQIPTEERYLKLVSSCRSTVDGIDARVFCTTNPLGVGHQWVKKRFVDVCEPMKKYKDPITGRQRIFIPGTVDDNPTLIAKDPEYVKFLEGLPDDLKKAWRYGSWDVMAGMFFSEFDRTVHVYDPLNVEIHKSWPRFASVDWGYSSPLAFYWHAVGPDQHIYTYREMYVTKMLDVDAARLATKMTGDEKLLYTVGDPQSFPVKIPHYKYGQMTAISRADVWAENGIPITMGNSERLAGWSRVREYLRIHDYMGGSSSWWHISNKCPKLIEEITSAVYDESNPEDLDTDCQDHGLDACRLAFMSRPPLFKEPKRQISMLDAAERQMEREQNETFF